MVLSHLKNPEDFYTVCQTDRLSNTILSSKYFWSIVFNQQNLHLPATLYNKAYQWNITYEKEWFLNKQVEFIFDYIDIPYDPACEYENIYEIQFNNTKCLLSNVLNVTGVDLTTVAILEDQNYINRIKLVDVDDYYLICLISRLKDDYHLNIVSVNGEEYAVLLNDNSIKQILYNILSQNVTISDIDGDDMNFDDAASDWSSEDDENFIDAVAVLNMN